MYEESLLIARIKAFTSYTDVNLTDESVVDLIHEPITAGNPKIFVGHLGIKLENPEDFVADQMHELENSEVLHTSVQFLCLRSDLVTVRTNIKAAWSGYSPFLNDSNYGSLSLRQSTVITSTGTNIWWQDILGLITPRIS